MSEVILKSPQHTGLEASPHEIEEHSAEATRTPDDLRRDDSGESQSGELDEWIRRKHLARTHTQEDRRSRPSDSQDSFAEGAWLFVVIPALRGTRGAIKIDDDDVGCPAQKDGPNRSPFADEPEDERPDPSGAVTSIGHPRCLRWTQKDSVTAHRSCPLPTKGP